MAPKQQLTARSDVGTLVEIPSTQCGAEEMPAVWEKVGSLDQVEGLIWI